MDPLREEIQPQITIERNKRKIGKETSVLAQEATKYKK